MQEKKRWISFQKLVRIIYLAACGLILAAGVPLYFIMHNYVSKANMISPNESTIDAGSYVDTATDSVTQPEGSTQEGNTREANVPEENTQETSTQETIESSAYYSPYYSPYFNPYLQSGSSETAASAGAIQKSEEAGRLSDADQLKETIRQNYEREDTVAGSGNENILLIASEGSGSALGENPMVMVTVDHEGKIINATTFQKDIYLQIPGEGNHRLGEAYQLGGAELLKAALEKNFKLKIDRYMQVDVLVFIDMIDSIGGLTLEVTKNELEEVNTHIRDLNSVLGNKTDADILKKAGTRCLTGKQALAYSWIGDIAEGIEDNGRQNKMMEALSTQLFRYDMTKLNNLLDLFFPKLTTNLTENELIAQLLYLPSYQDYQVRQISIPVEGSYQKVWVDQSLVLGIEFDKNIAVLQEKLEAVD